MKNLIKCAMFIIIPTVSVLLNILLETAQGETTEEVGFGILLGLVLDLIYAFILICLSKNDEQSI